jgi:hypothetical protein
MSDDGVFSVKISDTLPFTLSGGNTRQEATNRLTSQRDASQMVSEIFMTQWTIRAVLYCSVEVRTDCQRQRARRYTPLITVRQYSLEL